MSELKKQILQTLLKMHEEQVEQRETVQRLSRRVDKLENELDMAKELQSHLDESLSAVAEIFEALSSDSSSSQNSSFRRS